MKSIFTFITILFLGLTPLTAQNSIRGKIIDSEKNTLPFANIILHEKDSKENPVGTISDDNGSFIFENIKTVLII